MIIENGVVHTQSKGCSFCLHIGDVAIYFGKGQPNIQGAKLMLFTQKYRFRYQKSGK